MQGESVVFEGEWGQMVSGVVLLPGVVCGSDSEADCEVLAWKAEDRTPHGYSQFKVVTAPRHLPDGCYTVTFNGIAFSTTKQSGWWIMESLS